MPWVLPSNTPPSTLGGSILNQPIYTDVRYYQGDADVPYDVRNQRLSNQEVMRRMGTPVLIKRIFTEYDVEQGTAMESPSFDDIDEQPTHGQDALSHGVGFCSVATQPGEWYDPTTNFLYISASNPQPDLYLEAPRYRGYGPGYLTYAILPDRPEDVIKFTPQGSLLRTQTALAQLPWWPYVGDNDLVIPVTLNPNGTINETFERYQLKMVTPVTLHGQDRYGNREIDSTAGGNRYWIGQQAELTIVPVNDIIYDVETDR